MVPLAASGGLAFRCCSGLSFFRERSESSCGTWNGSRVVRQLPTLPPCRILTRFRLRVLWAFTRRSGLRKVSAAAGSFVPGLWNEKREPL